MQIDGISAIPPIGSISSAQQLDGPTSRSFDRSLRAQLVRQPSVRPRNAQAGIAARSRPSSSRVLSDDLASDAQESPRVDETEPNPGSIVDEIA